MDKPIPEAFVTWAYRERAKLVHRQANGEAVPAHEVFLGFTRHNPAVVSHGPAGLNASIKGVGWVPKAAHLSDFLDAYMAHIQAGWREGYSEAGLQLLMKWIYGPGCGDKIDFALLGSLELAKTHTWANLRANKECTLLFFEPPMVSFEARGHVEIHEHGDAYHALINAQHDLYHQPHRERWADRPAYLFHIEEMFDNSVSKQGFGKRIM